MTANKTATDATQNSKLHLFMLPPNVLLLSGQLPFQLGRVHVPPLFAPEAMAARPFLAKPSRLLCYPSRCGPRCRLSGHTAITRAAGPVKQESTGVHDLPAGGGNAWTIAKSNRLIVQRL